VGKVNFITTDMLVMERTKGQNKVTLGLTPWSGRTGYSLQNFLVVAGCTKQLHPLQYV
jgi:hypothetical protein